MRGVMQDGSKWELSSARMVSAGGRRPGDDPFLTEDDLVSWLPRVLAYSVVGLAVLLLFGSLGHRNDFRLVLHDGVAVVERGNFAPWGFSIWQPESREALFSRPVRVSGETGAVLMQGTLDEVSLEFRTRVEAELLRALQRNQASEIGLRQAQLAAVDSFRASEGWSAQSSQGANRADSTKSGEDVREVSPAFPAQTGSGVTGLVGRPEKAVGDGRWKVDPAATGRAWTSPPMDPRSYNAGRRALLQQAEAALAGLPPLGQGTPEQARDRQALQAFIAAMDTPAR